MIPALQIKITGVNSDIVKISTSKNSNLCNEYFNALVKLANYNKTPTILDYVETETKFFITTTCLGPSLPLLLTKNFDPFLLIYDVLFFMEEANKQNIDMEFPNITYFTTNHKNEWKLNFFKLRDRNDRNDTNNTLGLQIYNLFLGFFYPSTMKKYENEIKVLDDFSNIVALLLKIEKEIESFPHNKSICGICLRDPLLLQDAINEYNKEKSTNDVFNTLFDIPSITLTKACPRGVKFSSSLDFAYNIKPVGKKEARYYPAFTDKHFCIYGSLITFDMLDG